jgi:Reverse transcriptase (RNA-dependent DNA polymerase)
MSQLVDPSQTVFLQGRYILDKILVAHEIIHYSKVHKEKDLVLIVNFEKAYNKVNWNFIKEILLERGFDIPWVIWVKNLMHDAQTCININENPTQYFRCKRRVRHRDPLSPFLFDLVTNILGQIMSRESQLNLI